MFVLQLVILKIVVKTKRYEKSETNQARGNNHRLAAQKPHSEISHNLISRI